MRGRDEGNAFSDERGNDMNDELVDFAGVEKRSDDARAAHHPDVFSFPCAQMFGEFLDRFFYEFKTARNFARWATRESVILNSAVKIEGVFTFFLKTQDRVVGFSAPQDRVD